MGQSSGAGRCHIIDSGLSRGRSSAGSCRERARGSHGRRIRARRGACWGQSRIIIDDRDGDAYSRQSVVDRPAVRACTAVRDLREQLGFSKRVVDGCHGDVSARTVVRTIQHTTDWA